MELEGLGVCFLNSNLLDFETKTTNHKLQTEIESFVVKIVYI